ncbi:GvpL/GvpF family gas vesicle protein [Natroniella sulfidigena]|uniref:GvpL/GvpF family gas vesicle protein n=1 Tax=Natroniella sulfidigena TaxID=723921 RepID=UPI00200A4C49|nr:GvpL/GvpF family gas vesicle protein [Natroniella sulfidigena]MCK8817052.1 GvpL/GvpF family gas vesicle protein [Natroniella sulfidigena]
MNRYCFCVIKDNNELTAEDLELIKYQDIAMVTSEVVEDEILPTRDNVIEHEETINRIMEETALIPMSFGHLSDDQEKIERFLEINYERLVQLLEKFADKMELGLKIFWKDQAFTEEVEDQEIAERKKELQKRENPSQMEIAEVGKLVMDRAEAFRDYYNQEIYDKLASIAVESSQKDPYDPKMVLNAVFLVAKEEEDNFDQLVDEIFNKYQDKLDFKYTGPWPPYNFITEEFEV